MNGFTTLENIAKKYNEKAIETSLERSKRYMKTRYQVHCNGLDDSIASHCANFSLSDSSNKYLQGQFNLSDEICADCYELCETLENVQELAKSNSADADTFYDIDIAIRDIYEYIKHLMRDAQQKKAKIDAFKMLDNETGFWLKDFCQKILPAKFREGQKEYFGKKGMSLHVDIFFLKKDADTNLRKHIYLTAMSRCEQGTGDVISIADVVLDQFMNDEPQVKKLLTKSDNAGCYHGNFSAESVYNLCKKKGIKLLRYDFNEPCCGKDQCDRESAAAKNIIRSYVDAGNDLLNAEQLHKALHMDSV